MNGCASTAEIRDERVEPAAKVFGATRRWSASDGAPTYPEIRIPAAEFRAIKRAARGFDECIGIIRRRAVAMGLRYDLPFTARVDRNGDLVHQNFARRKGRGDGAYQ